MMWVHKVTGEIYEMRMTSIGEDNYKHDGFNSYEIGGVVLMGITDCNDIGELEFLGWL